ncbi:MAG TPA: DUF4097 family beta strand repeat-containing protein [Thermotogota bacterium]|nr:DUF4097 family beta strand repeat-containing protein [Thermotogota bacterium]HQN21279.1 DUF4097 family beta strand repeat-containing protein [Thermotogota bacterium]HQQ65264.1 DUF4097 family beta strand repeat-containing protein [Thermotogota bacterium]
MKKTFGLLMVLLLPWLFAGCNLITVKEEFSREIELGSIRNVFVQTKNGSIEFLGTEGSTIGIRGEKRVQGLGNLDEEIKKIIISYDLQGDRLIVKAESPSDGNFFTKASYGANFVVHLPPNIMVAISGKTSNGSLKAHDLEASLQLNTSNGGIDLRNTKGLIQADTSNGGIDLYRVELLAGINALSTSNGRIEGDILLPQTGSCRLHTSNGRINVRVPTGSAFAFKASTSNGSIDFSGLSVLLTQSDKTRKSGTVNNGSFYLDLETSNGNIRMEGF